jgi:MtN3 and saliva related transmembrane protein
MLPEHIGFLAALLTTGAFVPQAWMTVRTRDTRSISLAMYVVFNIGIALWLAYGVLIDSRPMVWANVITLALSTTILAVKWQNRDRDRQPPPAA